MKRLVLTVFGVLTLFILALTLVWGFNESFLPQAEAHPDQSSSSRASAAVTNTVYLPALFKSYAPGLSQITPGGGTVVAPGGQVSVTVPAGAVSGVTTIDISPSSAARPPGVSDVALVMEVKALDAAGQPVTTLAQPTTLQFNYGALNLSFVAESSLAIYHRGPGGEWTKLPTILDTANRTARATATQFSPFGLFGSPLTTGMPMGVAADAAGNAYWVDFEGFSIRRAVPGTQTSTVYYNLRTITAEMSGDAADLDLDRVTGNLYFTDGDRVWEITPALQATAIYARSFDGDTGSVPGDSVNGLGFDSRDSTLYIATKGAIIQVNPRTKAKLRTLGSAPLSTLGIYQDVVVDSRGRIFAVTTDISRGTVSFGGWGNMYYWEDGANAHGWRPVAYGFAKPRGLAADGSGNVYVANLTGEAISVVSGDDPAVTGFLKNVHSPRGIAVSGNTLVVAAYDSIFTYPSARRDAPDGGLSASISLVGSISGQGSMVTVSTSGHDPIPAHNTLRVGSAVIHDMASFVTGTIKYQLPAVYYDPDIPLYDPAQGVRLLTVPSGASRFSVGSANVLGDNLVTPELGNWQPGTWSSTGINKISQYEWLVWPDAMVSLESVDGLFPKWDSTRGRWLAYQFNQNGSFAFKFTKSNGQTGAGTVEVTRAGRGGLSDVFRVDPAVGGAFYSRGARLEIPAGALPVATTYVLTVSNAVVSNPSQNPLPALSHRYSVRIEPEPARLNKDIVLRLPYEPGQLSGETPTAAYFDSGLGDFVHIESAVAGGYVNITLETGDYSASASSPAGVTASALAPPGAGPTRGQKLRAAINTVGANLWWVAGLPNTKVEDDNFLVLYNTRDGTTEAYAQKLLEALDHSRTVFKGLGYAVPSRQVIAKTAPWATWATGAEGITPGIGTLGNWYMFFRDNMNDSKLQTTAAHELFHVLQKENMSYAARLTAPTWWLEGTAAWAEYAVYPDLKDYQGWLSLGGDFVKTGFDNTGFDTWSSLNVDQQYATVAFAIYLEEKKGQGKIKEVLGGMGLTVGFREALAAAVGDLHASVSNFLKDYWLKNYGPAKAWDLGSFIPDVELTRPANTVLNVRASVLSSGLVRVYWTPLSAPDPPASFSQASGSVAWASPCGEDKVYVLANNLSPLGTLDSASPTIVLEKLGSYAITNSLYFLYVTASGTGFCQVLVGLETPTISSVDPVLIPVSQPSSVNIHGGGFGPKPGTVSGGNVTSWSEDYIAVTMTPGSAGAQPVIVQHAEGVTSNPKTITVYVPPTPTPTP